MVAGLVAMVSLGIRQAVADRLHRPHAIDYAAFWGASALTLGGQPGAAYDAPALQPVEATATSVRPGTLFTFVYPPTFLLLCWPMALLPYLASLWLFLGIGYAILVAGLRLLLPGPPARLAILAFPAMLMNAGNGQTGFVTASCFAGGMLFLERRPWVAGISLGLLVFKPHLALCVPIGLVVARRWQTLAACAATALCLCALSYVAFGQVTWLAFAATARQSGELLADNQILGKMQSVFAGLRLLGAELGVASAGQVAAGVVAVLALVLIARRRPGPGPELSAIVLTTILATPYLFDYDLVCLAVPLVWWFGRVLATGALPWERIALLATFLLPLFARSAGLALGLPLTPGLVACLVLLMAMRLRHEQAAGV